MVDLKGIEPSTSRMRTVRSTRTELQALIVNIGFSVKYTKRAGGDGEDRTLDLLNAIQALSRNMRLHTPNNINETHYYICHYYIPIH